MEVRLRFGVIEQASDDGATVEDQVDVILGPAMVVKLRDLLSRLISQHFVEVSPVTKDKAPDATTKTE